MLSCNNTCGLWSHLCSQAKNSQAYRPWLCSGWNLQWSLSGDTRPRMHQQHLFCGIAELLHSTSTQKCSWANISLSMISGIQLQRSLLPVSTRTLCRSWKHASDSITVSEWQLLPHQIQKFNVVSTDFDMLAARSLVNALRNCWWRHSYIPLY